MARKTALLTTLAAAFLSAASFVHAQQPAAAPGDAMNQTRALLQKWSETEKMTAAERYEWEQGKALLEGRITLVQQSIEDMKKKMAEAQEKLDKAKKDAEAAVAEREQIKEASNMLLLAAPELEKGLQELLPKLPPNVQEKLRPLTDRLPKPGQDMKNVQAAARIQVVLGILNELNKANQEIASLPEIHDIGGGKKAEVKAIYVGLGQGYFVNAAGDIAGMGTPSAAGWKWTTDPKLAKSMIEVLDVMKKTVSPKLVELPATLD